MADILVILIRIVGWVAALILVAHIALTLGEANPTNGITTLVASWADRLHLGFRGLFTPENAKVQVAVDYGVPAVIWLFITWVLVRLVRRIGG